jgi:hypothetical protein
LVGVGSSRASGVFNYHSLAALYHTSTLAFDQRICSMMVRTRLRVCAVTEHELLT